MESGLDKPCVRHAAHRDPALQAIRERHGEPVPVPTLYIHGARHGGVGVENIEAMEAPFPNGLEKRVITDAGHFVHQEQPEVVNRLSLEFTSK